MPGTLIELLLGMSPGQFRAEHWPERPRQFAAPLARLAELADDPALVDIPSLLAAHQGPAWLHRTAADGRYDHDASVDTTEGARLFELGTQMDLRDLQRWLPPVRSWLARLTAELSLEFAAHTGYCHAFVSPTGTGTPKHFDNREVIVVQIRGRKRWQVAPNEALPNPLMPHVVGGATHAFNKAAGPALDDPAMPGDATTYTLDPGAVMFVPRGYWHATHALEDSLSLSFGFRIPSWAEMALNTMLTELAREPAWRATAYDVLKVKPPGLDEFARALKAAIAELRSHPPPPPRGSADEEPE